MLNVALAACTLLLVGGLTARRRSATRRLARLFAAQERWAEEMDRDAEYCQSTDRRLVA